MNFFFGPPGTIPLLAALHAIMEHRHGPEAATVELFKDTRTGEIIARPGTPDLEAISCHVEEARALLAEFLASGAVIARLPTGEEIAPAYWTFPGGQRTLASGRVEATPDAEEVACFVEREAFYRQLAGVPSARSGDAPEGSAAEPDPAASRQRDRRADPAQEADLRRRIEGVQAAARRKWPRKRPAFGAMAEELVRGQPRRQLEGFGVEAIRKILMGRYPAAKRLGIGRL